MIKSITALVPMKGHSERIARKNLKPLCGKPLCFWILETLSQIQEIKRIIVNTDDDEIAEQVTQKFNIGIHRRPKALQGDWVSMNAIIDYDLSQLADDEIFLQTHSTNPLLKPQTIRRAIQEFFELRLPLDSLFSVTRHQSRFYDSSGAPISHNPAELIRTQDLVPIFEENSNLYLFSRQSFQKCKRRIGSHPKMFEINALEAVDIDEPAHWQIAEALLHG